MIEVTYDDSTEPITLSTHTFTIDHPKLRDSLEFEIEETQSGNDPQRFSLVDNGNINSDVLEVLGVDQDALLELLIDELRKQ